MAFSVQMPALGESVSEGTVTRWLKKEGDTVEVDEPLLEVSTDKVDTEIPSPTAGTLTKIIADEDETVEIGGELALIDDGSGDSGESDSGDDAAEDEQSASDSAADESEDDEPAEDAGHGRARGPAPFGPLAHSDEGAAYADGQADDRGEQSGDEGEARPGGRGILGGYVGGRLRGVVIVAGEGGCRRGHGSFRGP